MTDKERQQKRLRQRLEADIKAGLVIAALVLAGYIAGRLTVRAAEPVGARLPVDKPLEAVLVRGEPELMRLEYLGTFVATYYCCERYPHICGNAYGGCSWSKWRVQEPVAGWDAVRREGDVGWTVLGCPQFELEERYRPYYERSCGDGLRTSGRPKANPGRAYRSQSGAVVRRSAGLSGRP